MNSNIKSDNAYKTIGEVAKALGLIDKKTGSLQTHTVRYWQDQFKQIKPTIMAGNRRYFSKKDFQIIKIIKFLLKDKGLTINGAKKVLNSSTLSSLDNNIDLSINTQNKESTDNIKEKVKKISKIVNQLKKFR